jgi:DNA polymerase III subunit delta'
MPDSSSWGLIGHDWAVQLLREHVAGERVRHAYLFTGSRGIGRRTLALRLAQALNCQQPTAPGEPCLACRACTHLEAMQHPDLQVVQAEREGGTLKIEQIRELQRGLSLHPYEAKQRIALILRFEEARDAAANALLKTLEEPPALVTLLLTAESAERVKPTIVSRCEVIRLRPAPLDMVANALESTWSIEPERARLLAHISGGRTGFALRLAQDAALLEERQGWLEDLAQLLPANRVERFSYIESFLKDAGKKDLAKSADQGKPPEQKEVFYNMLVVWLSLWRDVLLNASGASAPPANLDQAELIERLAGRLSLSQAHAMICAIEKALTLLDQNVNTRLVGEALLLDLPRV